MTICSSQWYENKRLTYHGNNSIYIYISYIELIIIIIVGNVDIDIIKDIFRLCDIKNNIYICINELCFFYIIFINEYYVVNIYIRINYIL